MNKTYLLLITFSLINFCFSACDIWPSDLKVEYLENPLAIERLNPRLSWKVLATDETKKNLSQSAYQILVASDVDLLRKGEADLWDSGKVISEKTTFISYNGKRLTSDLICFWKVKVWDQNGVESLFSELYYWGMGLLNKNDIKGVWIEAPQGTQQNVFNLVDYADRKVFIKYPGLKPALYFRKEFSFILKPSSARLHMTAKGLYNVFINGQRVGDSQLTPGWTDYKKTIQYQTYDVTELLQNGQNAIGVIVGTGWYSGYVGGPFFNLYGTEQKALVELNLVFEDGNKTVIPSDETWKVNTGPIIFSGLLEGETYYKDWELQGWSQPSFDDSKWFPVVTRPLDKTVDITAESSEPMSIIEEIKPKTVWELTPGVWIFDLEQNMAGWIKLKMKAGQEAGRIQIRYAEMLNPDGSLYVLNLRFARAIDTYVIDEKVTNDIEWEPHFTYHGFRYVEITGYSGKPDLETFVGRVMHSNIKFVGKMETSHTMVNKLLSNIKWGQKGNFISIPTDCPQRDERLGWMGDAETFIHTATYNADVGAFYTKFARDIRDGQGIDGSFADVSPKLVDWMDGSPAWGEAGIIIPWTIYRMYGDADIIEHLYTAMTKHLDHIWKANPNLLWTKNVNENFGEWLEFNASTPKDVMNTAYFAYDAFLLSKMAKIINKLDDSKKYEKLFNDISAAFNQAYVNATDGKIYGDTQTVYVLALVFDLLSPNLRLLAAKHLHESIEQQDWHLTTGFFGVNFLNPALSDNGLNDIAYRLLLQDTYPSWLYPILNNATTIWERWDGWTKDKGFQDPAMNSFNHYSLGSIGRWLYQYVAGIDTDVENGGAGFSKIIIKPHIGNGLTFVNAEYDSIHGLIKSAWKIDGENLKLTVTIPPNTKATIILPEKEVHNKVSYNVGSGTYQYKIKWNK